jgi:mRNA-degrading endonuclease RelE of RelBE toxin-antitoxin system
MIEILLSERIRKTADKLPPDLREKASQVISQVAAAFGEPHQHRGLGLRQLARRSYEIRVHLQ